MAAQTSDEETDALDLTSASPDAKESASPATRLFVEAAAGSADQRYDSGWRPLRRLTVDFYHAARLAPSWRAVVSNRLDHLRQGSKGTDDTVNSLREAYLGWDSANGTTTVEFGRINLRQGPGYGFNPTDFFRDGALRTLTSINPFSIRENRLGTVMLRGQRLWEGGSVSLALAPKLADAPSDDGLSLSLGATNNRHRIMLSASRQFSERVNAQALLYKEPELGAQVGASLTALLGAATVAHAEWSNAQEPSLADRAVGRTDRIRRGNRFAGGLTYTTGSKLSVTAELQTNAFALSNAAWDGAGGVAARSAYLLQAEQRQDLAARHAVLVYLSKKDLGGLRNLHLSGFVRQNLNDHSRLHWAEMRYQWPKADLALQWQVSTGKALSQYWLVPERQVVQVLGVYHLQ
jgi:hypothetical protein